MKIDGKKYIRVVSSGWSCDLCDCKLSCHTNQDDDCVGTDRKKGNSGHYKRANIKVKGKLYKRVTTELINRSCASCALEWDCDDDDDGTINKYCIAKDKDKGNTGYYEEVK